MIIDLKFKFDIIAVTESWNPEDKKYKFSPPIFEGYSPYTGTTGSSLKGGCGFYINSDLKFQPRKDLNMKIKDLTCEVESCWIEIIIDKQPNILICVLYRHPRKMINKLQKICLKHLTKSKKKIKKCLLLVTSTLIF